MKVARLWGIVFLVVLVVATIGFTIYLGGDNEPPAERAVVVPPEPAAPPVAAVPAPPAPSAPVLPPPAITKIAAAARHTSMDRPMNRVIKNWLGCHDKQAYLDTMAMLSRNDPASGGQFTGEHAACVALAEGQQVGVTALDDSNHLVRVKMALSGEQLWTDPSALDGAPSQ